MNGQAPNQNGSTPGTLVTPGGKPSALLDDPTFSAIHDALLMGWSIIELKSRIQVAAMSTSISGSAQTLPAKRSVDSTNGQVDKVLQDVLSAVENAKSLLLLPESAILQEQPANSTVSRQNLTDLPDNAWLTSLWRATFTRIAESHKRSFPESSTAGTYYDLPDRSNTPSYQVLATSPQGYDGNIYLPYLYLHPVDDQDYGNIGIQSDSEIPAEFKLYDVARRALNCLTLLYTDSQESLIPVTVNEFQKQLVQNISNFSQLSAALSNGAQPQSDPTTPSQPVAPQGGGAPAGQPVTASSAVTVLSFEEQRNNAIQLLSNQAVRYLETWDSYAREALYVSGGGDAEANEMQLIAYEAGRAVASLSWGITTETVPIEDAMNQRGESSLKEHPELTKHLEDTWLNVFDERDITSIQHQISALSTALDEAYYRVHPDVPRQDTNDVGVQPNLDLPSQGIRTVSESLNYWMHAVQLIGMGDTQQQDGTSSNAPSTPTDPTAQSRLTMPQPDAQNQVVTPVGSSRATASASGTAQPSTIGSQTGAPQPAVIPAMTWETSSQLRLALIQQAEVWQSLLAGHQSLRDFTTGLVTQRIWNDFSRELEQAISTGLLNPVEKQIRRYTIPIAAAAAVLLAIIVIVVLLLVLFPSLRESLITAFVFIVGSVLGFFGTVASRVSAFFSPASNEQPTGTTAAPGSPSAVPTIAGLTGAALIDAFQNGYKQILIEFDYLNHNVSVTYPLVEYFILRSAEVASSNTANNAQPAGSTAGFLIKDAYDFLVNVVWTGQERADEIGRIARAAFGPIGAFVGAQFTPSSTQNSTSSTSKRSANASISRG